MAGISARINDLRFDIRDGENLKQVIRDFQPDFVFHLAAQALVRRSYVNPVETWQTNTMGTINLLEALRCIDNPCVAVLITSDKCYDNVEWVWGYRETDRLGGPDPYSASKGGAELAIRSYVRSYFPKGGNVRIGIGRAGNVIGGGDWAGDRIVPDCIRAWVKGDKVSLRQPASTRPWQHVLEPLSGYLNLAMALSNSDRLHGEPFNFGPSLQQNYSVGELVDSMANYWSGAQWEDVSVQDDALHESGLLKLNCDKALHHLRWHSVWDFEETVARTTQWYAHFYEHKKEPMADYSLRQIDAYIESAREKGVQWAVQ